MTKKLFFLASMMLVVLVGCNKEKKTDPDPTSDTKKNEPVSVTFRFWTSKDMMTNMTEKVFVTPAGEKETELQLGNPIMLTETNDPAFHVAVSNVHLSDSLFYYYDVPLKLKRGTHSIRYEYTQKVDSLPEKINYAVGGKIVQCGDGAICVYSSVKAGKGMKTANIMSWINDKFGKPEDFTIQ